mmetsp:Transcript_40900/g.85355  ORF Transcript_40900/g.85355 Transcript_40900/m.85355 type:complete len:300 (+) Transcript_40900:680-1579(+)
MPRRTVLCFSRLRLRPTPTSTISSFRLRGSCRSRPPTPSRRFPRSSCRSPRSPPLAGRRAAQPAADPPPLLAPTPGCHSKLGAAIDRPLRGGIGRGAERQPFSTQPSSRRLGGLCVGARAQAARRVVLRCTRTQGRDSQATLGGWQRGGGEGRLRQADDDLGEFPELGAPGGWREGKFAGPAGLAPPHDKRGGGAASRVPGAVRDFPPLRPPPQSPSPHRPGRSAPASADPVRHEPPPTARRRNICALCVRRRAWAGVRWQVMGGAAPLAHTVSFPHRREHGQPPQPARRHQGGRVCAG